MKPRWQKAIIKQRVSLFPHLLGREIWVDADGPCEEGQSIQAIDANGNAFGPVGYYKNPIRSNVIDTVDNYTYRMQIPLAALELLSEFREAVEMVKWEDFVK